MTVEDATERKTLERQLLEGQKFEAIGQLAGGIAHDLNNMIGAIMGWVDLGIEEAEASSPLHRYFTKVRRQAERATSLTRQLLAFARRQILEPQGMDLNQSVIETLSLLEKVIGSNMQDPGQLGAGRGRHPRRSLSSRAGRPESLHQCARRHARGRLAHRGDLQHHLR